MNLVHLMGLVATIAAFGLVGELEYRETEDSFNHCMDRQAPYTDAEIVERIQVCEQTTGFSLPKEEYP